MIMTSNLTLMVSVLAVMLAVPALAVAQDDPAPAAPTAYQAPAGGGPETFPEIKKLLDTDAAAPADAPRDATTPGTPSADPAAPGVAVVAAKAPQLKEGGGSSTYCDRSLGQWFYCQDPQSDDQQQAAASGQASQQAQDDKDVAAAKQFAAQMERARQVAVWNPSEENLRRYYAYQQVTMEKSGLFADKIRRIVWADPSLDYDLKRPVNEAGKTEWLETRMTDRDLFFRQAYDQVGIFYIYRGSCGPCRTASPIVAEFGRRYGFPIQAISTDGAPNPEFADFKIDKGQLAAWGITNPMTPAYLIYQKPTLDRDGQEADVEVTVTDGKKIRLRPCLNPKGCVTYFGAGVLSIEEMADRLYVTLATEPGRDF